MDQPTDAGQAAAVKPRRRSLAALLREAKRRGMDDVRAAEYAGLTGEELQERIKARPKLARLMRQARAQGLGDHLQSIKEATQWQAHQYVIEKLWCEELSLGSAKGPNGEPMYKTFREVSVKMTPDQLLRAAELLELGRLADNQRKAAETSIEPCTTTLPTSSPALPPAPSATPPTT